MRASVAYRSLARSLATRDAGARKVIEDMATGSVGGLTLEELGMARAGAGAAQGAVGLGVAGRRVG